jgi:hypothetical protein
MRKRLLERVENGRLKTGLLASDARDGANGAFMFVRAGAVLRVIASDGMDPDSAGWQHVSVSLEQRAPTWEEMCFIKNLFWGEEETVIQLHPPRAEYVNCHPNCLHLWRHRDGHPTPPMGLVGPK